MKQDRHKKKKRGRQGGILGKRRLTASTSTPSVCSDETEPSPEGETKVTVSAADVEGCRNNEWLSDVHIDFWFECLGRKYDLRSLSICLLKPSVTFLLSNTSDESALPKELHRRRFIFMPINDNDDVRGEGGYHWSLALADTETCRVRYYDSMSTGHARDANAAIHNLSIVLGKKFTVRVMSTPQQDNGQDCGVFVCLICETLIKKLHSCQTGNNNNSSSSPRRSLPRESSPRRSFSTLSSSAKKKKNDLVDDEDERLESALDVKREIYHPDVWRAHLANMLQELVKK